MADVAVSALPLADPLDGTESFPLLQTVLKRVVASFLRDYVDWARPADWPAMPTTAANTIHALAMVSDHGSNLAAIRMTTSSGTWSIDWGDGTSSTGVASNVTAEHAYDFADGDLPAVTSRGYKVAVVTVTADSGNFTGVNTTVAPTGTAGAVPPWLEMQINGSAITSLLIYAMRSCEHIDFVATGTVTSFQLASSPFLQKITRHGSLYSNLTTMASMFNGCTRLPRIDLTGLSTSITSMVSAFQACTRLSELVFPAGTLGSSLTDITNMCNGCTLLRSVTLPAGAFSNVLTATSAFTGTQSLESMLFPSGALAAATGLSFLFSGSGGLRYVEFVSALTAVTTIASLFLSCTSLKRVKFAAGGFGSLATTTNAFLGCPSLSRIENCSIPVSFSVASCRLGAAALDEIYTALPSASATITVTSNYGTSGDTASIATGKGWTVTGS